MIFHVFLALNHQLLRQHGFGAEFALEHMQVLLITRPYVRQVSLSELRRMFHSVVLTYGAQEDRRLDIPGAVSMIFICLVVAYISIYQSLRGVLSAHEFVSWYNGHPDFTGLSVGLDQSDTAVIIG